MSNNEREQKPSPDTKSSNNAQASAPSNDNVQTASDASTANRSADITIVPPAHADTNATQANTNTDSPEGTASESNEAVDPEVLPEVTLPTEPPKPSLFARCIGKIRNAIRYIRWRISYFLRSDHFLTSTILGLTLLFFIIFFTWAANMNIEKTVKAQGVIMAITENQIISHLEGGVIKTIYVAQGDTVEANDPLIEIVNMDMRRDRARYLVKKHFLEAVIRRLDAERDGTDFVLHGTDRHDEDLLQQLEVFTQNKDALNSKINILKTQRAKLVAEKETKLIQRENLLHEWQLAAQQVAMLEPLVKEGIGSMQNLLQRQSEMAKLKTAVDDLGQAALSLDINIQEADEKIAEEHASFLKYVQEEIAQNITELNTVLSELVAIDDSIERSTLRAPIGGTIHRMHTTTIGGVVRAGDALIEIVPEATSIRIEAKVQPQDRTNIYNHQEAKVRPTSYSFSLDTMLLVDITSISAQTFFDDQTRMHYYKVFLESQSMPQTEQEKERYASFMPGMIVEVNILSGEESLLHYLFTPIIRGLDNALTERATR